MTNDLNDLAASTGMTIMLIGALSGFTEDESIAKTGPRGEWMAHVARCMQQELVNSVEDNMIAFDQLSAKRDNLPKEGIVVTHD